MGKVKRARLSAAWVGVPLAAVASVAVVGASWAQFSEPQATLVQVSGGSLAFEPHHERSDCVACHQFNAALSHPVGQRPSMALPPEFPLVDGRVACVTCHEVKPGVTPTLRGAADEAGFCTQCHEARGPGARSGHTQGVSRAHLASKRHADRPSGAAILDPESQECMTCHDGIGAGDAGNHAGRLGTRAAASDHPIGVKQRSRPTGGGRADVQLTSPQSLDPRIRLFNDAVGCGSCHSVYSKQDNLLVMSNQQSQLCLKCHIE